MSIAPLDERIARYEAIVSMRKEGKTCAAIAELMGLSKQRVQQIEAAGRPRVVGRPRSVTDR